MFSNVAYGYRLFGVAFEVAEGIIPLLLVYWNSFSG
jgi:hypothetical protein